MKVCDKCGRRAGLLWPLEKEFSGGGYEICSVCHAALGRVLDQVEFRFTEIRRRGRRQAFVEWWGKPIEEAKPQTKPKKPRFSFFRWLTFRARS